jgi:hypothetical protein
MYQMLQSRVLAPAAAGNGDHSQLGHLRQLAGLGRTASGPRA